MEAINKLRYLRKLYHLRSLGFSYINPTIQTSGIKSALDGVLPNDFASFKKVITQCHLCTLCKRRKHAVVPKGSLFSKLFFVLSSPDMIDDDTGEILSNKGGLLLDKILESVFGMKRSNIYTTYAIKCRIGIDQAVTTEQIDTCQAYLLNELKMVQPKLIIALGHKAFEYLFQNQKPFSFKELLGQATTFQNYPLIPTYSLIDLIKNPSLKKEAYTHFLYIKRLLQ